MSWERATHYGVGDNQGRPRRCARGPQRAESNLAGRQLRSKDGNKQPLYVRRNVIEDVLDEQDMVLPVRRLADDGLKAWQQVIERGYQGLVAKDPASPYVGGRTLKWLKVKQRGYRVEERGLNTRE